MEEVGVAINSMGSVLSRAALEEQRRKRGECLTCGRKCYQKKLFKTTPITEEGKVLNGRCLECKPLDLDAGNSSAVLTAMARRTTPAEMRKFSQSQSRLSGPGVKAPALISSASAGLPHQRRSSDGMVRRQMNMPPAHAGSPTVRAQHILPPASSPAAPTMSESSRERDRASVRTAMASRGMSMSAITENPSPTALRQTVSDVHDDIYYGRESNSSMGQRSVNSAPHDVGDSDFNNADERYAGMGVASIPTAEVQVAVARSTSPLYPPINDTPNSTTSNRRREKRISGPGRLKSVSDYATVVDDQGGQYRPPEQPPAAPAGGMLNRGGMVSFSELRQDRNAAAETNATVIAEGDWYGANGTQSPHQHRSRKHPPQRHAHFADQEVADADQYSPAHTRKSFPLESSTSHHSGEADHEPVPGKKLAPMSSRNLLVEEAEQKALDRINNAGNDYKTRIKVMKKHPASALIQQEAMKGISTLDLNEKDYDKILRYGGPDACVMGMRSHPHQVDVQIHGCRAMWNLSQKRRNKVRFMEAGALDCVMTAMLGFSDNCEVQESAMAVIASLCGAKENNKEIMESKTLEKVVETMNKHSEEPTVQEQGCEVVTNLSANTSSRKRKIMESGAGGAVVVAMVLHPEEIKLQEAALTALQSLCTNCVENNMEMENVGGIDAAITAMQIHRDEPGVQEAGACTLSVFADDFDNIIQIGDCGGIDVIVRAMWVHSDVLGVQECCCGALWKLTTDEQNRNLVIEVGGISALVNTMQAYVNESSVQEKALGVLANLALNDLEWKIRIVEEEALEAIVMAMVVHSDVTGVQKEACNAVETLAVSQNYERMKAANVSELIKTAGERFPLECGAKASQVLDIF